MTDSTAAPRTTVPWLPIGVAVAAFAAGAVIGGYLDFLAWHANAAITATIPVAIGILLAIIASIVWFRSRGRVAGLIAVAAIAYVVGARFGAWVAPSAHPTDWSPGTVALTLSEPPLGAVAGTASCSTQDGGAFSVSLDAAQDVAGTEVLFAVHGAGADGNRGSILFEMIPSPDQPAGFSWTTNQESMERTDILDVVKVTGDAASGSAELAGVPLAYEAEPEGETPAAFGGPAPDAISGTIVWTCEPPRGVETPIEGSWFS